MTHQIKISADVTSFKKEMTGLGREIENLSSRKRVQIFDKETRDFIKENAKMAISEIRKGLVDLETENKKILKSLKEQNLAEDDKLRKTKELIANKRKIVELEKDISNMEKTSKGISIGGTLGKIGDLFKGVGLGGIAKMFTMNPATLALAGVGAVGAYAGSRAMQGYSMFKGSLSDRMRLRGMGFTGENISGISPELQELGVGPEEARGLRIRATEIGGRANATNAVLGRNVRAARLLGLESGSFLDSQAQLRGSLGGQGSNQAVMKIQAALFAQEFAGEVKPWLETMTNVLVNINENGVGLDTAALTALSGVKAVTGVAPELAQKMLGSIDQAMKGATGERAAFFMSAMAKGGLGKGSIAGLQLGMEEGLFGGSKEKVEAMKLLNPQRIKELQQAGVLGGNELFQKKAAGITGRFEGITKGMGAEGQAVVANAILGTKGTAGILTMDLLKKLTMESDPQKREQLEKRIQEIGAPLDQRMLKEQEKISHNTEVMAMALVAGKEATLTMLGETAAPMGMMIEKFGKEADKTLVNAGKMLGLKTEKERTSKEFRGIMNDKEKAEAMIKSATPETLKTYEGAVKEEQEDIKKKKAQQLNEPGFFKSMESINETFRNLDKRQNETNDILRMIHKAAHDTSKKVGNGGPKSNIN